MSEEPENLVLVLLREMRADMARLDAKIDSLRADVASDLLTLEKRLSDQIVTVEKRLSDRIDGLYQAVTTYHSSTIGHSAIISELEGRVRQLEKHPKAPSKDAH